MKCDKCEKRKAKRNWRWLRVCETCFKALEIREREKSSVR